MSKQPKYVIAEVEPMPGSPPLECSFCGAPADKVLVEQSVAESDVKPEDRTYEGSYAVCDECLKTKIITVPRPRPS